MLILHVDADWHSTTDFFQLRWGYIHLWHFHSVHFLLSVFVCVFLFA